MSDSDELAAAYESLAEAEAENWRLRTTNAELLAALREVADPAYGTLGREAKIARAALAKAGGKE